MQRKNYETPKTSSHTFTELEITLTRRNFIDKFIDIKHNLNLG